MRIIYIANILKERDSYPKAGSLLFQLLENSVSANEKVTINLKDVELLPSMFLNVSIGEYIKKYGIERLKENITFAEITSSQAKRISQYVASINKVLHTTLQA